MGNAGHPFRSKLMKLFTVQRYGSTMFHDVSLVERFVKHPAARYNTQTRDIYEILVLRVHELSGT